MLETEKIVELPDPMDKLKQESIEILMDWVNSPSYNVLKTAYKNLREKEILKKSKKGMPMSGDVAMYRLGEIQGQLLELDFLFKVPELAKHSFDKRANKNKTQEQKEIEIKKVRVRIAENSGFINPLTGV